jgi:hypothetical protein
MGGGGEERRIRIRKPESRSKKRLRIKNAQARIEKKTTPASALRLLTSRPAQRRFSLKKV